MSYRNFSQALSIALQHLAAGKRDLLISDPNAAVASLATACEMLSEYYGETAFECGEVYYYYGRALLDLARMEAGVIDNVLDGGTIDCRYNRKIRKGAVRKLRNSFSRKLPIPHFTPKMNVSP